MKQVSLAFIAILAIISTAKATTIVSTFISTPPGYEVGGGYEVSLFNSIFGFSETPWAMGFTVPSTSDFLFTGFKVPMTVSGTTTVDFTLASDAGGALVRR